MKFTFSDFSERRDRKNEHERSERGPLSCRRDIGDLLQYTDNKEKYVGGTFELREKKIGHEGENIIFPGC